VYVIDLLDLNLYLTSTTSRDSAGYRCFYSG
jgi:hypothetical protein